MRPKSRTTGRLRWIVLSAVTILLVAALLAARGEDDGPTPGDAAAEGDAVSGGDGAAAQLERLAEQLGPIQGAMRREVGEGGRRAIVLWSDEVNSPPLDVVAFLPAWGKLSNVPNFYRAWLAHLVARGSTVIYPTYFGAGAAPGEVAGNVLAGVEAGLAELGGEPESLVIAGHTTGGALAFDYAAAAKRADLPRPAAIFAIYPARNPAGRIPPVNPGRIAPETEIVVLSGEANPVLGGEAQARRILRSATRVPQRRRRYLELDPRAEPLLDDRHARRGLWRPLDRLIAVARHDARARQAVRG